ncbi:MAG: DMT family transporter, partial [Eubacteriales bacterium]|nr:DMT family transporter [Eubacteriales bacterium]
CLPSKRTMLFSLFALVGVGLVSLGRSGSAGGFGFSGGGSAGGQLFLLAAACFYAVAILVTARLTGEGDTVIMGIFQVGTIGGLGLVGSGAEGSFALPQTPLQWFFILILAVACTGFGYTLQPVAQHYLPAEKVSLMCAANPLTAGLISVCILREPLTPLAAAGELVIFLVLLLSTGAFPALDTNKTSSVSQ